MTWVVASAQGLIEPLCQIHSGYCMRGVRGVGNGALSHEAAVRRQSTTSTGSLDGAGARRAPPSTIHQQSSCLRRANTVRTGVLPRLEVCSSRSPTGGRVGTVVG